MGLTNGETYTISIAGTSSSSMLRVPSPVGDVALGKSKTTLIPSIICMRKYVCGS